MERKPNNPKIEPLLNAKSEHSPFVEMLKAPILTNILGQCAINVKSHRLIIHCATSIFMSKRVMVDIMKVIGPHIIAMKRNFNVGKTHPTTSSKPQFHA